MFLQDSEMKIIDPQSLKAELMAELSKTDVPSRKEVEDALATMYQNGSKISSSLYYRSAGELNQMKEMNFMFDNAGKKLWEKVRKFICKMLSPDSTVEEIIEVILEAIAAVIPGGVIIKKLVLKVVKYFLQMGYDALCPVTPSI